VLGDFEAHLVRDVRYKREAEAFLKDAEPQEGAIASDELMRMRTTPAPPELTGSPELVRVRSDVLLPLADRAIRVRLHRDNVGRAQPVLLWLHGGAFVGGTLDDIEVVSAGLARRTRFTVLSLEYRLAPKDPFPAALNDTYETLVWLEEHGEALGSDGRLFVGGQSSGANLVASACLMARERQHPDVLGQILCYPWLDFGTDSDSHRLFDGVDGVMPSRDEWYRTQYLADAVVTPYAAPLIAPDLSALPPALVIAAGLDPLRDDARRYARRLDEAGVDVSYVEYEDTPHAFLNFPGALSVAWRALADIAEHLKSLSAPLSEIAQ
jgi:acetyl esterase